MPAIQRRREPLVKLGNLPQSRRFDCTMSYYMAVGFGSGGETCVHPLWVGRCRPAIGLGGQGTPVSRPRPITGDLSSHLAWGLRRLLSAMS